MRRLIYLCAPALFVTACSSSDIDSNEEARRAYLGLDESVGKSIQLGFDGFNAASSANIDPQATAGTANGTITITGQVDQGASANKGMRLHVGMVGYDDGPFVIDADGNTIEVTYDTSDVDTEQPFLSMMLKNIPTGTLDGTLSGTYILSGDIESQATLDLVFDGQLQDGGGGSVIRVTGSTHVTGTLTTDAGGTFDVDVTL